MSVAYLVDTDWVIDHLNQVRATMDKLKELRPEGVGVSVITVAELYEGVLYSRDPARSQRLLDMFLHDFPLLGIDLEICRIFGQERGKLRKQGKTITDFDLLIASTCLRYGLTLLSNNRRHFEMVEDLPFLSLP